MSAALFAAVIALGGAAPASATTGPEPLSNEPIFTVTNAQAKPFLGRFKMTGHTGQLITGALGTRELAHINGGPVIGGQIEIYAYDDSGQEVSWLSTTYEYRKVKNGMKIDLFSPDGKTFVGRMLLKPIPGGRLKGWLKLNLEEGFTQKKKTFGVTFTKDEGALFPTSEEAVDVGARTRNKSVGIFTYAVQYALLTATKMVTHTGEVTASED
jgi:hypothetical protein